MKILTPEFTFRWITPEAETEIASAARLCYQSEQSGKSDEEMLRLLMERGHWAMFDHASASYQVIGDRGFTHEAVRHRIGAAFSMESTRYCNYAKEKFDKEIRVIPFDEGLNTAQKDRRHWLGEHIERVYMEEISEGIKPQQARDWLPTCLKAEIRITLSFTAWFHFFDLRDAPQAHPRMHSLAHGIYEDLCKRSLVFRLWREHKAKVEREAEGARSARIQLSAAQEALTMCGVPEKDENGNPFSVEYRIKLMWEQLQDKLNNQHEFFCKES